MTKINRREYLKQMGAGAGVIAGVTEDLFADPQRRKSQRKRIGRQSTETTSSRGVTRTQFQGWPDTSTEPATNAPVTLIFGGLMGFFYNTDVCDIGFHPGDSKHKPEIRVWEKTATGCNQVFAVSPLPSQVDHMVVGINRTNPLVRFFEDNPQIELNRKTGNAKDFRWLLDLDDMYPTPPKKKKQFNRTLRVRHGTFYTRMITNSTFYLVDVKDENNNPIPMGRMPLLMAAALQPATSEYVTVTFQKQFSPQEFQTVGEFNLYHKAGSTFEIQFLNHCKSDGCPKPEPKDPKEENRNDFHFLRKVLDLPGSARKYGIKIDQDPGGPYPHPPICELANLQVEVSDPAPCMGAGYGGGGGP